MPRRRRATPSLPPRSTPARGRSRLFLALRLQRDTVLSEWQRTLRVSFSTLPTVSTIPFQCSRSAAPADSPLPRLPIRVPVRRAWLFSLGKFVSIRGSASAAELDDLPAARLFRPPPRARLRLAHCLLL